MKLLLDTHIWIWSVLEPWKLTSEVARVIAQPDNALFLSPISIWELSLLAERKRVVLNGDLGEWCKSSIQELSLAEAPLTWDVAAELPFTRLLHRDPGGRLLVATARVFDLTLITAGAARQASIRMHPISRSNLVRSATNQKLILFGRKRYYRKPSNLDQRRGCEKFVGFDFGKRNWLREFFARRNFHLWIFGVRYLDGDDRGDSHSSLSLAGFIDNQAVADFHFAKIPDRNRIRNAVPDRFIVLLQIGEGVFRWLGFQ
jgi:PIN domain nuclease of toxin-antitoxin system